MKAESSPAKPDGAFVGFSENHKAGRKLRVL